VTGITLSEAQRRVALDEIRKRQLNDRVSIALEDYGQHQGSYDRVVSVGMLEHVGMRNLGRYFAKVGSLLKPDGVAVIHSISSKLPPGPVNPWIRRYIFPGGYIPSLSDTALAIERSGMSVADVEVLRGHYAKTIGEWSRRFARSRAQFANSKGETFCRVWELYLAFSQTAFETGPLVVAQWQLGHHNDCVPLTRNYLYQAHGHAPAPPA
jgi:cyclopropane-fatty-acyl-phospholipid synthase